MSVRASIVCKIDACIAVGRVDSYRTITASKPVNYSKVELTIPAGPRSKRTVTVHIEVADLNQLVRELTRNLS